MQIDHQISASALLPATQRVFQIAAEKTATLDRTWDTKLGTPVFTVEGKYSSRGWTEWTQGFQYGCLILTGDAVGDQRLVDLGRKRTIERMLPHVTHIGVHDHGFNNLSTYGNLLRLMNEGRIEDLGTPEKIYLEPRSLFSAGFMGDVNRIPVTP